MLTRKLAVFVAGLEYSELPLKTVQMSRLLLLDGLGCLLAGTNAAHSRNTARMVRGLGGAAQATIYSGMTSGSVRDAAFVNGISLYSVGLNDVHVTAESHPGASVIPTILAIGEWKKLPGSKIIAAMVAGYELVGRIGKAVLPSHRQRGFHATGTCGTFGAAAAAARALDFDADKTANTFGMAGSQAAGLYECHHDGTSTMIYHAGRAAQNGVEAALLVENGMTGPATVFEGSKGFFRATSNVVFDAAAEEVALKGLGHIYELDATSFRPYFGCSSTLAASAAIANLLHSKQISLSAIEEIVVQCHPIVAQDNADIAPQTLLAARLSMPFNLALVLHHGDVWSNDLPDSELGNQAIRDLLPKITLVPDPTMSRRGASITVRHKDGHCVTETILDPRGSEGNPLSWDEVVTKFRHLTEKIVTKSGQDAVIDAVKNIDRCNGADLASAMRAAAGSPKKQ